MPIKKPIKKSRLLKFIFFISFLYILFSGLLYFAQRSFLYMPSPEYPHSFEQIKIQNDDALINIIVLNPGNKDAFLYFGGNAESVVTNADVFAKQFPNKTMYLLEYRAYGSSTGKPSENALVSDALAAFDEIALKHTRIAVIGRSLGSGVAVQLAAKRPVERLLLITPFDSILAIAKKQFPVFPVALLLKDTFDSVSFVDELDMPVMVIAGSADTLIPIKHTQLLHEAMQQQESEMIIIENAGHNNISRFPEYYAHLTRFLRVDVLTK